MAVLSAARAFSLCPQQRIPAGEGSRGRAASGQGHAVPLQARRQGRAPLVLGAAVPDEEGRRSPASRRRCVSRRRARAATRSRAPSCAASGTRRCGRPWWSRTRRHSTAGPSARSSGEGPQAGGVVSQQGGQAAGTGQQEQPSEGADLEWPPWRWLPNVAFASHDAARMDPGGLDDARRRGVRLRPRGRHPRAVRDVRARGGSARHGHPDRRAARVPRRDRRLRLLGPLHDRRADAARTTTRTTARAAGRTTSRSTPTTR